MTGGIIIEGNGFATGGTFLHWHYDVVLDFEVRTAESSCKHIISQQLETEFRKHCPGKLKCSLEASDLYPMTQAAP